MSIEYAEVALAEYKELKAEQRERIKVRDGLPYLTLGVIFLAVGAVIQAHVWPVLLVVPPAVVRLAWLNLRHDRHIVQVRCYVRDTTAPALSEAVGRPVLQWEADGRTTGGKRDQLAVDLLSNTGACLASIVATVLLAPNIWVVAGAVVDLAITAWITVKMVQTADLGGRRG